jgi:hypothetical protein
MVQSGFITGKSIGSRLFKLALVVATGLGVWNYALPNTKELLNAREIRSAIEEKRFDDASSLFNMYSEVGDIDGTQIIELRSLLEREKTIYGDINPLISDFDRFLRTANFDSANVVLDALNNSKYGEVVDFSDLRMRFTEERTEHELSPLLNDFEGYLRNGQFDSAINVINQVRRNEFSTWERIEGLEIALSEGIVNARINPLVQRFERHFELGELDSLGVLLNEVAEDPYASVEVIKNLRGKIESVSEDGFHEKFGKASLEGNSLQVQEDIISQYARLYPNGMYKDEMIATLLANSLSSLNEKFVEFESFDETFIQLRDINAIFDRYRFNQPGFLAASFTTVAENGTGYLIRISNDVDEKYDGIVEDDHIQVRELSSDRVISGFDSDATWNKSYFDNRNSIIHPGFQGVVVDIDQGRNMAWVRFEEIAGKWNNNYDVVKSHWSKDERGNYTNKNVAAYTFEELDIIPRVDNVQKAMFKDAFENLGDNLGER